MGVLSELVAEVLLTGKTISLTEDQVARFHSEFYADVGPALDRYREELKQQPNRY